MSADARCDRCKEDLSVRLVIMLLAKVISSPSSTHAIPRAAMTRVWKRLQGNRSIRAGMVDLMTSSAAVVALMRGVIPATGARHSAGHVQRVRHPDDSRLTGQALVELGQIVVVGLVDPE